MKKIPTLFEREFENHRVVKVLDKVTPGLEWVLEGGATPTVKWDGSCCAIIGSEFYKRFDAKKGRKVPDGAIPCCDPDPITGHWPHWVKIDISNPDPSDKWFVEAYKDTRFEIDGDWTYEAIGKHFNGNPYQIDYDILVPHGRVPCEGLTTTFEGIRDYLSGNGIEGIVFWKDQEPVCKIKRTDFGFEWPIKHNKEESINGGN